MNEVGGLGENQVDLIATALRNATIAHAKETLSSLVMTIDGKNAGHCLQMISAFCTAQLDVLTALVPGLATPKTKSSGLNLYTSTSPGVTGVNVGPMNSNETFGASIITQAISSIGPMIQSRKIKEITSALAEAKTAELSEEIQKDLETSLKDALGIGEATPIEQPTAPPLAAVED